MTIYSFLFGTFNCVYFVKSTNPTKNNKYTLKKW